MACVGSHVVSDIPEKNAAFLLQGKLPRFRCKDFHQSEPEKGEEGKDLLPSQQNLKLLSETTGATNGHFLAHNGENFEFSMLQYICEVPLCAVLVGKWEIIVPALI
jgi:hypothetical protein